CPPPQILANSILEQLLLRVVCGKPGKVSCPTDLFEGTESLQHCILLVCKPVSHCPSSLTSISTRHNLHPGTEYTLSALSLISHFCSLYLCQYHLRLRQPEGHLHRTIQVDGGR